MKQYKTSEKQRAAVTEHYWKNRAAKLAYAQKYRAEHATELQAYRDEHREGKKVYNAAYQIANCEVLKVKSNRYFAEHPGYREMSFKRWVGKNKEKNQKRKSQYHNHRRKVDPLFRLQCNLRARIHQALKSRKPPSERTMKSTGCTIQFLKGWLESRFQPGMSWDNYGNHGWHVDHVIPCNAFDLSKPEEALQCFHYSNLQPLWAKDNLRKGHNFVGELVRNKNNITGNGELQATRQPDLHSAATKPKIVKA